MRNNEVIVTDNGFKSDLGVQSWFEVQVNHSLSELASLLAYPALRLSTDSFSDGRAFTLAKQIRLLGYTGQIRLRGELLPDQYTMARRSGIDEIEISNEHADRCQEEEWRFRAVWTHHDYQDRLRRPLKR